MIRMETACFLILAFVALLYFSAIRAKTKLHKSFSVILIVVLIHLVFDGATLYTVNHLDTVPLWLNDTLHRFFIGTIVLIVYLFYSYIFFLVEDETGDCKHYNRLAAAYLVVSEFFVLILPVSYAQTPDGNYEAGIHANVSYVSVAVYLVLCIFTLIRHWKSIHFKKKFAIGSALLIEVCVSLLQAANPTWLISGMGITLMTLALYLTLENPDVILLEQVREEKRKAEEANASKSAFLSVVSHEIRTPMNAVVGMTDLLLRDNLTEKQEKYLKNIKTSGESLVMIVNDLLDQSKIEAGKMEIVEDSYELKPMLDDVRMIIENRIEGKPIQVIYNVDEKIPSVLVGDSLRIRQILINLMNNAVKFTESGYIKLSISIVSDESEKLKLKFSVKDTGQGIRPEDLNRLFMAFSQVDVKKNHGKEGTGLGLSISRDFINMMGGKLEVASEYGKGSEFFFSIYQGTASPENAMSKDNIRKKQVWQEDEFTAPEARVLIVDDTEINLMVTRELMAPLQMQIDTADSGKKALSLISNNRYDIIFMDYLMPYMDGVETTDKVRHLADASDDNNLKDNDEYYRSVPIIALTGDTSDEAKDRFKAVNINDFIEKPVSIGKLKQLLIKWLPEEMVHRTDLNDASDEKTENDNNDIDEIEGLDVNEGIKNCGSVKLFKSLLGDFYKLIDSKSMKLEKLLADDLVHDYTIEVHALKNTARMIGALQLSEEFYTMEQLGNAGDIEQIKIKNPKVLELFRSYKPILEKYGYARPIEQSVVPIDTILQTLTRLHDAIDSFNLDEADSAMKELESYSLPEKLLPMMEQLRVSMADVAMEDILNLTEAMSSQLK